MLMSIGALLAGLVLLVWSADRFVAGSAATARNLGVSTLIVGLTVVGFGTSAPELLVSGIASFTGNPDLAVGNAIGSNIANVGLILGICALVRPLTLHSRALRRELPLLLAIMLGALALLADGTLSRPDGIVLLAGMGGLIGWLVWLGLKTGADDPLTAEILSDVPDEMPLGRALMWLVIGLLVLLGSARMMVWGAVNIAQSFGIPDVVIGLSVVAIGTSLPELAASLAATLKGEDDIAIGNVLGSNMFNLLGVLGLPGVIAPGKIPPEVLTRDFPAMLVLTLLVFVVGWGTRQPARLPRPAGLLLLASFGAYVALLYYGML